MNSQQLDKLHSLMQRSLDEIDRICEMLNLRYYLIGGTLLGAVRHKGFIPWDDDLDVAMPREDYNVFLRKAPQIICDEFFLQTRITDPCYGNMFSKLLVKNTVFDQSINANSHQKSGIFVDIFPLDRGKPDPTDMKQFKINLAKTITSYLFQKRNQIKMGKLHALRIIPDKLLIGLEELLYKGKGDYYINYGSQYGIGKQTISITHYEPRTKLVFEGKQYSAPKDYNYILERIYGKDYMTLPPVEKRITHNPMRLSFNTNGPDEVF